MPLYVFQHPQTAEIKEIFFHMNDEKQYTDGRGVEWNRVFTSSQLSMDTQLDPYSSKDFLNKTSSEGTMGDLWDRSSDLHHKRVEKEGVDPLRKKYFKQYSKARNGAKHPEDPSFSS